MRYSSIPQEMSSPRYWGHSFGLSGSCGVGVDWAEGSGRERVRMKEREVGRKERIILIISN